MATYGIFNGTKLTKFKNANSLQSLAKIYIKYILREEGIGTNINKESINYYLNTWMEWSQDTEQPYENIEEAIDQAQSTIVYSNIHFINCDTKKQISSGEREILANNITEILTNNI